MQGKAYEQGIRRLHRALIQWLKVYCGVDPDQDGLVQIDLHVATAIELFLSRDVSNNVGDGIEGYIVKWRHIRDVHTGHASPIPDLVLNRRHFLDPVQADDLETCLKVPRQASRSFGFLRKKPKRKPLSPLTNIHYYKVEKPEGPRVINELPKPIQDMIESFRTWPGTLQFSNVLKTLDFRNLELVSCQCQQKGRRLSCTEIRLFGPQMHIRARGTMTCGISKKFDRTSHMDFKLYLRFDPNHQAFQNTFDSSFKALGSDFGLDDTGRVSMHIVGSQLLGFDIKAIDSDGV